jgi:hypothetical protein
MNGNILRRRMVGGKNVDKLLYPDAYMIAFDCAANTRFQFLYNAVMYHYILDGVEVTLAIGTDAVTPKTSGTHILYFWVKSITRLSDKNWSGGPKYLRVTGEVANWLETFVHNVGDLRRIDFTGATPPLFSSGFGNHLPNISEIRVPIGTKAAYVTALSKAGSDIKNKSSIIVETKDFSYNI